MAQELNVSEIVREYKNRLAGFIRKRVNRTEDAEDILQEVFYQLAEADWLMKPIDQIAGWLFTVARNRITDLYRKKKPEPLPEPYSDEEEEIAIEDLGSLFIDEDSNPETEYLRSMVMEEFEEALNDLSPEQRQAFELNEIKGMSFNEISKLTGEPVNTLISR
ncbi:MAG: sigma-70 family RNA polymerase sigma factor, partial [Bacteroidales bacterium]|nr:sigma-70 family RNA polymerase sigma factor [Bacteroidales bacterium]